MKCRISMMLLLLLLSAVAGFAQTADTSSPPSESTVTFENWKLPEEYEQELVIWFAMLALAALFSTILFLARQRQLSPEAAAQLLGQLQPERERLAQEVAQVERRQADGHSPKTEQLMELTRLCNRLSSNSTR